MVNRPGSKGGCENFHDWRLTLVCGRRPRRGRCPQISLKSQTSLWTQICNVPRCNFDPPHFRPLDPCCGEGGGGRGRRLQEQERKEGWRCIWELGLTASGWKWQTVGQTERRCSGQAAHRNPPTPPRREIRSVVPAQNLKWSA